MRTRDKNVIILLLLLLSGSIVGGFIGDAFKDTFSWLAYGKTIGVNTFTLDLNIIKITLGFIMNINIASIIGIIIAIFIFTRL
ncbi:DUF4321 domain-containing protein [Caminicella sporogenes]|uniref:DUF4321 domain-containing protein n=1 Tax=Caminicella sporogenes TaxID=166485 RepID=UPI0025414E69|nr:DUF4321 domain-containing protein [Caminicella sporogenes]WIF94416.1 DUF4321 domain-containing protein [Caminicella sporogenes]